MTLLPNPGQDLPHTHNPEDRRPAYKAWTAWQHRFQDTAASGTLTDWKTSTAPDGRTLHTARVTGPNPTLRIAEFTDSATFQGVRPDQPRPALDFTVPGRVQCVWLLDGAWVELWAPDPQVPAVPPSFSAPDRVLQASPGTPSARLPFTRRLKTRKENAA